jgi:uncharacterized membrane protein
MKKTFLFVATTFSIGLAAIITSCNPDPKLDCSTYNSTYNTNMKAIIDAKCVTCHKAGGSAESLGIYSTYAQMKPNFSKAWTEVDAGRMPQSGSPKLTDKEKEAFECWKNGGFKE